MGTNNPGVSQSKVEQLLDAIIESFPKAKIIHSGILMYCDLGGAGRAGIRYNQSFLKGIKLAEEYNKKMEKIIMQGKYINSVFFVDILPVFDVDFNMQYKMQRVNKRNPKEIRVGVNNVHPSKYGYYQIADAIYMAIHNLFLIKS